MPHLPPQGVPSMSHSPMLAALEAFNAGKRDVFQAQFTDDAVWQDQDDGRTLTGPQALTDDVWLIRDVFPDMTFEIVDSFAAGDRGVVETQWHGTHRGTLSAAGRTVASPGAQ